MANVTVARQDYGYEQRYDYEREEKETFTPRSREDWLNLRHVLLSHGMDMDFLIHATLEYLSHGGDYMGRLNNHERNILIEAFDRHGLENDLIY